MNNVITRYCKWIKEPKTWSKNCTIPIPLWSWKPIQCWGCRGEQAQAFLEEPFLLGTLESILIKLWDKQCSWSQFFNFFFQLMKDCLGALIFGGAFSEKPTTGREDKLASLWLIPCLQSSGLWKILHRRFVAESVVAWI